MWVPIPFERSFRMAYSRTHHGTRYDSYHHYVRGARLSQPIRAWDGQTPPDQDVLDLLARSGTDLAPAPGSLEGNRAGVVHIDGELDLPLDGARQLPAITRAMATIRALQSRELRVRRASAIVDQNRRVQDRRSEERTSPPLCFTRVLAALRAHVSV
jgi:hypothetical protein